MVGARTAARFGCSQAGMPSNSNAAIKARSYCLWLASRQTRVQHCGVLASLPLAI